MVESIKTDWNSVILKWGKLIGQREIQANFEKHIKRRIWPCPTIISLYIAISEPPLVIKIWLVTM